MNNIIPFSAERKPTHSDDSEPCGLPPGFSVSAYPILACHWFGAPPFVLDENGETEPVKSRRLG